MATLFPLRTQRTVTIITKTSPEVKQLLKPLPWNRLPYPHQTRPPPPHNSLVSASNHPHPFLCFLFWRSMALSTKAFWLGVLKKSDIFPIIKNSFHLNQLQYIYLASTRHCPTALVCLGLGGLTKGRQLKMPSSSYNHQNILWPRRNHRSYS